MGRVRPEKVIRASFCCFLAACLSAPATAQDPVIKVNVRLVRMLVTVKDAAGQLIGSLNKGDFTVYDNGVQQDIAVFLGHVVRSEQLQSIGEIDHLGD